MTISQAREFFSSVTRITKYLEVLENVGLGYIKLGQPATTLSGGEAQRVKLRLGASPPLNWRTVYMLDRPTTGLHFEDVRKLLGVLQELADKRAIRSLSYEHNLDVIKSADWVIILGPEGGKGGGMLVTERHARGSGPCGLPHGQVPQADPEEGRNAGGGLTSWCTAGARNMREGSHYMANPESYRPRTSDIPKDPGVYRFIDPDDRVIYVGKAKNLRQRL